MTAANVRAQIANWFQPPAVEGLQTCYPAMPYWAGGDKWELAVNDGWGAVAYVHLREESESRIGLGGATGGIKEVTYQVGLVLLFKWLIPTQLPAGQDESSYVLALDTLIDSVKARIRSDRTFGSGPNGIIWQAGTGENDLKVARDLPRRQSGAVLSWQVIEFEVVEMIAA